MSKQSGRQRSRDLQQSSYSSSSQGIGAKKPDGLKTLVPFSIVLFAIPVIGIAITALLKGAASPPTTQMPVPVIEMIKATAEDEMACDNKEKKLVKKVAKLPPNSPELFGLYGNFGYECEGCGVYEKAEKYYEKAMALGPIAYKSYEPQFAKTGDFELNYVGMLRNIGRWKDSAKVAGRLWTQQTKTLGPLNKNTLNAAVTYARALGEAPNPVEQEKISSQLLALLDANKLTGSGEWIDIMICLGASHQAQNQMHDAKICYEKALAYAEKDPNNSLNASNLRESLSHFGAIK